VQGCLDLIADISEIRQKLAATTNQASLLAKLSASCTHVPALLHEQQVQTAIQTRAPSRQEHHAIQHGLSDEQHLSHCGILANDLDHQHQEGQDDGESFSTHDRGDWNGEELGQSVISARSSVSREEGFEELSTEGIID
jgi:hypothetical protein